MPGWAQNPPSCSLLQDWYNHAPGPQSPTWAHLRAENMLANIHDHFYRPGVVAEVKNLSSTAPQWQLTSPWKPAPMIPLMIINVSFECISKDLFLAQHQDLCEIESHFLNVYWSHVLDVWSSIRELTHVIQHDIKTLSGVLVWQQSYQILEGCSQSIEEVMACVLHDGITKASNRPYSSPIIIGPKSAGSFCNDFWRLKWPRLSSMWTWTRGTGRWISLLMLNKRLPPALSRSFCWPS